MAKMIVLSALVCLVYSLSTTIVSSESKYKHELKNLWKALYDFFLFVLKLMQQLLKG